MTDLTLVRGDSRNIQVTILESDQVTPIDLTGSILRAAVKEHSDDDNGDAVVLKTSYDSGILITDAVNGVCLMQFYVEDTFEAGAPAEYCWDFEVNRKGNSLTLAGTIAVTRGSGLITGAGLVLDDVKVGDIILPSGLAGNDREVLVVDVGGSGRPTDPGAGNLLTDYVLWNTTPESGVAHEIFRGDRKTPTGLSGKFTLTADVVT